MKANQEEVERLRKDREKDEEHAKKNNEEIRRLKTVIDDPNRSDEEKERARKRIVLLETENRKLRDKNKERDKQIEEKTKTPPAPSAPLGLSLPKLIEKELKRIEKITDSEEQIKEAEKVWKICDRVYDLVYNVPEGVNPSEPYGFNHFKKLYEQLKYVKNKLPKSKKGAKKPNSSLGENNDETFSELTFDEVSKDEKEYINCQQCFKEIKCVNENKNFTKYLNVIPDGDDIYCRACYQLVKQEQKKREEQEVRSCKFCSTELVKEGNLKYSLRICDKDNCLLKLDKELYPNKYSQANGDIDNLGNKKQNPTSSNSQELDSKKQQLKDLETKAKELIKPLPLDTQITILQKEIKILETKATKNSLEEVLLSSKKKELEELLKRQNNSNINNSKPADKVILYIGCGIVGVALTCDTNFTEELQKEREAKGFSYEECSLNLQEFISLKELKCSRNQLTCLVLPENGEKLIVLDVSDNQLTELILGDNRGFVELNCRSNLLTKINFKQLNPQKLKKINLENNNFFEQDLTFLKNFSNLEEVNIGNYNKKKIKSNIYNRFCGSLEPLRSLTKLKSLSISNTEIDRATESAKVIFSLLPQIEEKIKISPIFQEGNQKCYKLKKLIVKELKVTYEFSSDKNKEKKEILKFSPLTKHHSLEETKKKVEEIKQKLNSDNPILAIVESDDFKIDKIIEKSKLPKDAKSNPDKENIGNPLLPITTYHAAIYLGNSQVAHIATYSLKRISGKVKLQQNFQEEKSISSYLKPIFSSLNSHSTAGESTRAQIMEHILRTIFIQHAKEQYSFLKKNCQHFATLCVYGVPFSDQVISAVSKLGVSFNFDLAKEIIKSNDEFEVVDLEKILVEIKIEAQTKLLLTIHVDIFKELSQEEQKRMERDNPINYLLHDVEGQKLLSKEELGRRLRKVTTKVSDNEIQIVHQSYKECVVLSDWLRNLQDEKQYEKHIKEEFKQVDKENLNSSLPLVTVACIACNSSIQENEEIYYFKSRPQEIICNSCKAQCLENYFKGYMKGIKKGRDIGRRITEIESFSIDEKDKENRKKLQQQIQQNLDDDNKKKLQSNIEISPKK
ncbi:4132_t:CDS:10 [Funneliformis geosporum]|uniref:4132_t:CDS:1 n=1 Tax=Funneliformis geosporum TaxID=1117311 RepID=A0A9W4SXM4_9GLOM|nr:4132_t:CDS:10 [Funneliformis geosporum]